MVGGVRNGAAEEDWCRDLNPDVAATGQRGSCSFGGEGKREDHGALAEKGERTMRLWESGDPWRQHS